jgi:hypothetical protein
MDIHSPFEHLEDFAVVYLRSVYVSCSYLLVSVPSFGISKHYRKVRPHDFQAVLDKFFRHSHHFKANKVQNVRAALPAISTPVAWHFELELLLDLLFSHLLKPVGRHAAHHEVKHRQVFLKD